MARQHWLTKSIKLLKSNFVEAAVVGAAVFAWHSNGFQERIYTTVQNIEKDLDATNTSLKECRNLTEHNSRDIAVIKNRMGLSGL